MLRAFGHRVAMCCDMLVVVGSRLKMDTFEPKTPNMSQHGNRAAKRTQHVTPNNVALCCVGRFRLSGRGFSISSSPSTKHFFLFFYSKPLTAEISRISPANAKRAKIFKNRQIRSTDRKLIYLQTKASF